MNSHDLCPRCGSDLTGVTSPQDCPGCLLQVALQPEPPPVNEASRSGDELEDSILKSGSLSNYTIIRPIGKGGMGTVYEAEDIRLERRVAIKVPNANFLANHGSDDDYLKEAKVLASLDHPNIVPLYDIGSTPECPIFIVAKYVEGSDLARVLKGERTSWQQAGDLTATIAEALHYAHKRGIIHRDVKPSNILLDKQGDPFLADFGLALRDAHLGTGPKLVGTPAYMSPEQARGESHRVDGRTDIFSLGVVFYQLLTGQQPFRGADREEVLLQLQTLDPKPPRQFDETIPKEIERICLKAIFKRAADRYSTAHDMADDLRICLKRASHQVAESQKIQLSSDLEQHQDFFPTMIQHDDRTPTLHGPDQEDSPQRNPLVIPKGLRAFDRHDADFFLELLPGPRDRYGIPESIRFWKQRIEENDPTATFAVGVLYGPSGSGKSSLVNAGLLPLLGENIDSIHVEASPNETCAQLLHRLHQLNPTTKKHHNLKDALLALRSGHRDSTEKKLLIVIDQFEQWLHANRDRDDSELAMALRQCDGTHVQCLILLRDDFWLGISRFMRGLEIRLVDGENCHLVDRFDRDHAIQVLAAFGRAYGRIPDRAGDLTDEQMTFLIQAVDGIATEGKLISLHLAMFAEMMKAIPWTLDALRDVGGADGIGVRFLENTFSSSTAPPENRVHQKAARAILKTLLPESSINIKGHMRSTEQLLVASGYGSKTADFNALIEILDRDLRLITPTDPEGTESVDIAAKEIDQPRQYYQLTHDYLVRSLHVWLNRKQQETRQGRAELCLAQRSELWQVKPENRNLPSLLEWANIQTRTDNGQWSKPQSKMMRRASRVHAIRCGFAAIFAGMIAILGFGMSHSATVRRHDVEATRIVEGLLRADISQVQIVIDDLKPYRKWANDDLERAFLGSLDESNAKLHSALAILPQNPQALRYLKDRLLLVPAIQFPFVRDQLYWHRSQLTESYWKTALDESLNGSIRFRALCALATFDGKHKNWQLPNLMHFTARYLVNVRPSELSVWRDALWPVFQSLTAPLSNIYRNSEQDKQERFFATTVLSHYLSQDAEALFDLMADANNKLFPILYEQINFHRADAISFAHAEISKTIELDATESEKERIARRRANSAVYLLRNIECDQVWPLLRHNPNPRARSYLIHWMAPLNVNPRILINRYRIETDPSVKRALLLALGEFDSESIKPVSHSQCVTLVKQSYQFDPDAGVHAAAEFLLKRWGLHPTLSQIDQLIARDAAKAISEGNESPTWYVSPSKQSFVILNGSTFQMGSSTLEQSHHVAEALHRQRINRRFAIATTEVTRGQWQEFFNDRLQHVIGEEKKLLTAAWVFSLKFGDSKNLPFMGLKWFRAVEYCNWLSEQDGIPKDQWCFEPNKKGRYGAGMIVKPNFLELSGYRLPTESEWEFACRAGTNTSRYYGQTEELLKHYAWYLNNSQHQARPVGLLKPNDFGLFDMLGNSWEWCFDKKWNYPVNSSHITEDIPQFDSITTWVMERVHRGGALHSRTGIVRSANRSFYLPSTIYGQLGFRVARTLPQIDTASSPKKNGP